MPSLADYYISNLNPNVYGYPIRDPYPSELLYYMNNRNVGGQFGGGFGDLGDKTITLNPYSRLNKAQKDWVAKNEAARMWMLENQYSSPEATTAQKRSMQGTPYGINQAALNDTMLARVMFGDPSAIEPSFMQRNASDYVYRRLNQRKPASNLVDLFNTF